MLLILQHFKHNIVMVCLQLQEMMLDSKTSRGTQKEGSQVLKASVVMSQ